MVVMILFGIQAYGDRAHYIGIFCGVLLFCQNSDVHMYLSTYWEVKKKDKRSDECHENMFGMWNSFTLRESLIKLVKQQEDTS